MKISAIRDAVLDPLKDLAWLLWYEEEERFIIEISEDADVWSAPFMLSSFIKKDTLTLNSVWSMAWVRERIVPEERQNLGMILRANGLTEYDPYEMIRLSGGRCAQDDCFLVPLTAKQIPDELRRRLDRTITGSFRSDHGDFVFFRDGAIVLMEERRDDYDAGRERRLSAYLAGLDRLRIRAGGHEAEHEDGMIRTAAEIRKSGQILPFSAGDMRAFLQEGLVDTASAAEMLGCTRQNIQDLVRRGKLKPVMKTGGSFVFLRSELVSGGRTLEAGLPDLVSKKH